VTAALLVVPEVCGGKRGRLLPASRGGRLLLSPASTRLASRKRRPRPRGQHTMAPCWPHVSAITSAPSAKQIVRSRCSLRRRVKIVDECDGATRAGALLDELAATATAGRLRARADATEAELYRASGFAVEPIGSDLFDCVRILVSRPADAHVVSAVTLGDVEQAIRASWCRETSCEADWSEAHPARGQCDVTALLVRELLRGEILVANVLLSGRRIDRHAWNRLPSGLTLDLTREQFVCGETFEEPVAREPLGLMRARERYALLAERVRAALQPSEPRLAADPFR
jgi:hypothetical protein